MRTIWQVCKTRLGRFAGVAGGMVWLLASQAMASAKPATKLVNVADTRLMDPGFSKWVADVYNSNLWLYGLMVVVIMATMGLVLGFGFDRLISLVGIDLGKLDHHE
jgi:hypothetical protein